MLGSVDEVEQGKLTRNRSQPGRAMRAELSEGQWQVPAGP